jgi:broad specificity phosphatase PhoE
MLPTSSSPSLMPPSLKPGLTLYFCRHGETQANVLRRFQGRNMDTPLTEKGCAQARTVAAILERDAPDFARLAAVSSPLRRARLTMEIIRETLGLPRDLYATDDRLMEIALGAWEGLTAAEARARFPVEYEERAADRGSVPPPGGGECYADVAKRAESWIADLQVDTFAVSHGAFTRILRGLFQDLTWQQMSDLDEPQGVLFRVRGRIVERLEPVRDD